ncbi:Asp23/Gls24 family envelope stress response protein [Parasporobacterium paucivorans]
MKTKMGEIIIDGHVIAKYAGLTAVECFGIVGMAAVSVRDGIIKLLKRESLEKGINVVVSDDNQITIDFHVIISYGVRISVVSDNLISNVKYKVEEFTGMTVKKINIFVEGVRVID